MKHFVLDRMRQFFPERFRRDASAKHKHYDDFGWHEDLAFEDFYFMFRRNSLAAAAIDKTIAKTWETYPSLWETEQPAESDDEQAIRRHFARKRIWQMLAEADRRAMVGAYSSVVLLLDDDGSPYGALEKPVGALFGGIQSLKGVVPLWETQLTEAATDGYNRPTRYRAQGVLNSREIHPSRVITWSEDGTRDGRSALEPGFNDLVDAEKVKGAGGEGFWKTSRGAPIISADESMTIDQVMAALGVTSTTEAVSKINEQWGSFQQGYDKALMLSGMTATPLTISLPQPEEFHNIPVKSFAASMQIPVRVLLGNETGERSSTEDDRAWSRTNMARRENVCLPILHELVSRLVGWRVLPERDWTFGWESLLDATPDQKLDRAGKLAAMNTQAAQGDDPPFLPEEIREAAGYQPTDLSRDDTGGEDA